MTNREKFEKTFGVDIVDIDFIEWEEPYRKLKKYHAVLDKGAYWGRGEDNTVIDECYVYASSIKKARAEAIKEFGNNYRRYVGSGKPMFAVSVTEVSDEL